MLLDSPFMEKQILLKRSLIKINRFWEKNIPANKTIFLQVPNLTLCHDEVKIIKTLKNRTYKRDFKIQTKTS
ncbi:hypothetical protein GYH30_038372 [Glycine max]|uniref:Uncharacterized protein n=1 Tax=Glycine max TaxID=3847 RepID=A0A0R0H7X0_SOYBN|nr:hypothetical protein JHK86_038387 [Glycine max]KAH1105038.1 hypothetical protein GYH30_038372 [Glycine max]